MTFPATTLYLETEIFPLSKSENRKQQEKRDIRYVNTPSFSYNGDNYTKNQRESQDYRVIICRLHFHNQKHKHEKSAEE